MKERKFDEIADEDNHCWFNEDFLVCPKSIMTKEEFAQFVNEELDLVKDEEKVNEDDIGDGWVRYIPNAPKEEGYRITHEEPKNKRGYIAVYSFMI